jgi:hypothetical protein
MPRRFTGCARIGAESHVGAVSRYNPRSADAGNFTLRVNTRHCLPKMQSQSSWYLSSEVDQQPNCAEQAYREAISTFDLNPKDQGRFDRIQQLQDITDLERLIQSTRLQHERRNEDKKIGRWLAKLSSRICHYGRIFDVLAQHHPEYVSLAWGAMKLLFIVCNL